MGFLARRRIDRLVRRIADGADGDRLAVAEAQLALREHADLAVPRLLPLLDRTGRESTVADTLRGLVDERTLPHFVGMLAGPDRRVAEIVADILAEAPRVNVEPLLALYQDPDVPDRVVTRILAAHRDDLRPGPLFRALATLPDEARPAFFELMTAVIDEASLEELVDLLRTDDPGLKVNILRILGRFASPLAAEALLKQLDDTRKSVRLAALESLAEPALPVPVERLCEALRDPDIVVQSRAVDTIARRDDPLAVRHLLQVLQDESEYVRRAAVEVLNRVGTTAAIKDLIVALEDSDWWVRVRAADALGEIGGEKVVDAVMALTAEKDTFVRRFAVEILNANCEPRARPCLERALLDGDWWVRERAVDALAAIGDRRSLEPLLALLARDDESVPHVLRALAQLGDAAALPPVERLLASPSRAVRREAERTVAVLRGEEPAARPSRRRRDVALAAGQRSAGATREGFETALEEAPPAPADATQPGLGSDAGGATLVEVPGESRRGAVSGGSFDVGELAPGDVVGDRYRVVRRIGRGAFGEVILVDDQAVGETIVLKFLHRHLTADPEVVQRFVHELRYTRRIAHENVIRIYDFVTLGSLYAMSMEYFESRSLAAILKQGPIERGRAVQYARDICHGMEYAHQAGVVHRDLKPGNVLINGDHLVKVVDFGLAAATGHMTTRMTRAGVILGTPNYMAPEQIHGESVDVRTDVYSLGIILYEMFTGTPPYHAEDPMAVLYQHTQGRPVRPRERVPDLTPAVEEVILKAMAPEPGERYPSMAELDAALAEIADGERR